MCPSGHMECNESLEEALKREMREELGIDVKKSRFLFSIKDKDPFSQKTFYHNFMLVEFFNGKIKLSKEAEKLKWLDYKEIKKEKPVLIVKKLIKKLKEKRLL